MWKFYIGIAICLLTLVYGSYSFLNGADKPYYEEALRLEEEGNIREAHKNAQKAIEINPKSRKAIALKARLYVQIQNDDRYQAALKARTDAVRAMDRGDFSSAADKLAFANDKLANVEELSSVYKKASELQVQVAKDIDRLNRELPESYYNKAQELRSHGELERAYNLLSRIKKPVEKVSTMKDEIAFQIAKDQFDKIKRESNPTLFILRDTINWYSLIENPTKEQAAIIMQNTLLLKKRLEEAEKRK